MYCLSSQPFLNTWYSSPKRNATSEPERTRTYMSALAAVRVKRGSATITLQPFSLACRVCSIDTGCASAAFEPKNSSDFEFCSSLYELVIAPYPQVWATPATVVLWQMRAWWSVLFVPQRRTHL